MRAGIIPRVKSCFRHTPRAAAVALLLASAAAGPRPATAADEFSIPARRAAQPPDIDGHVTEREWQGAARAEHFLQFQPQRGAPAELPTVVHVLYDDEFLYAGFQAWDPEPPLSQMIERDDPIWNDDSVQIFLDTFHDRRTGYYFMVNGLGTQSDGRIAEDGGSSDGAWDAPWRSRAQRTDYGWSAEIAIPLTSIQYRAGDDVTWGINFGRSRRRSLERTFWAGPVDYWARLSMAGTLVGLDVPRQSRRHQVIPYALSRAQERESPLGAVGLDVRYAVTPHLSAYGTVNPDFATIEADQELVNLTRFEVSLAEKRQFFLEGGELFNQRIRTFYSRRIADIEGGGKLLGKQGPWAMHVLATRADPLAAGSSAGYAVARVQRDVAARSNVGVLLSNRTLDGRNQGSVGGDASLYFTENWGLTGQFVHSYGQYSRGAGAFFVRPSYDSATAHFHVGYTHLGDRLADNVNVVGFIVDDDRREVDAALNKTLWLPAGRVERIQYDSAYDVYWGQTGILRSWQMDESISVDFRNRWTTTARHTEEFKRFERDFRNRQTGVEIGYNTRSYQSFRGGVSTGRNFDADFVLASAVAQYKLTDRTSTEYELQRLTLDPDPGGGTWIHVVRASRFFTPDLFLRVFLQTNSVIDRRNVQAVFVYRYRPPFGTIQVAYQRGTAAFGQRSDQGHTLFLKVTTVL
ncbi:MAG: carbohydrate binding family 9 domain-containing protein [Acidobacteria bacterium]|nr:carbohydrate binding family 9 domain-containing protein [Acidobacteriota bacterium]